MIVLCSVCSRAPTPRARSLNAGILVLLGVTCVVLGCLGMFFVALARRARAAARRAGESEPLFEAPLNPAGRAVHALESR
jgi:hypothetical protein